MFKVIGRAILGGLFYIITLPLRILDLLCAFGYSAYCKITGTFTWRECWELIAKGVKERWNIEMQWIKTGKVNLEEIEL